MRYKRKINYVDAVRWTGENKEDVKRFANGEIELSDFDRDSIVITTPNGQVIAEKGDWICKDSMGKLYPCNSEVFRMTYVVDNETDIEEYEEEDTSDIVEKAEALVAAANNNGGKDNIAVILIEPFADEVNK